MGFSVSDSILQSWRRWLCSWTYSIPKYHSPLIWRTRDSWITKSSPLTAQAAIWCDGTGTSGICSLTIPPVSLGSAGSSAWQRRGKHPACRGLSGQDSCSLGPRCIPAALSSPLTLPGSAGVWGRALEHGNHLQLEEEKSLNCWITAHAPISVQGKCGEGACSCHQICHLPLITYNRLIFYPLLYLAWHWETITDLMLIHG